MRLLGGLCHARPSFFLFLLLVLTTIARVSADPPNPSAPAANPGNNQGNNDQSTTSTAPSVTETTASPTETTPSTSATSTSTSTTTPTPTTETTTSTTPSPTTTTTSMNPTTTTSSDTSTSTSTTSSTTSTASPTTTSGPIVTIPPTANAPYMQTTSIPEGTVFIAVGAILGLIGLAVLAWRGMVAWSVNRSVRRAAMAQSAESKRLLRGNRKKRSAVYSAAPAGDVSLEKLPPGTRSSAKASRRGPSSNSGLFFSPTAGNTAGAHNAASNRGSTYLPAGYYAAAGTSTPARGDAGGSQAYPPSSPSMPPTGAYHDSPHGPRASHVGASTSSLNLNQPSQGRAPSAYLEDLFESHAPPRNSESGRR